MNDKGAHESDRRINVRATSHAGNNAVRGVQHNVCNAQFVNVGRLSSSEGSV